MVFPVSPLIKLKCSLVLFQILQEIFSSSHSLLLTLSPSLILFRNWFKLLILSYFILLKYLSLLTFYFLPLGILSYLNTKGITMVVWLFAKSVPSRVLRLGIQILNVALNKSYLTSDSNIGFRGFFITFRFFIFGNYLR